MFPFGPVHGSGLQVVKRMPRGCRERIRLKPDTRAVQRGPSKASGLQRLLVVLGGVAFEVILTQPSLGPGQPAKFGQVSPIFLMSFTSSSRKWFSRKSQR